MANILEKNAEPAISYSDYNFQKQHYDLRFSSVDYQVIYPTSGVKNVSLNMLIVS